MNAKEPTEKLVAGLAKEAGVSAEDVQKVLNKLGVEGLISNLSQAGTDPQKIEIGSLKLAVRMGRGGVMV
jgi:DNA-binding transcriptional regulator YhcF (GntR family)